MEDLDYSFKKKINVPPTRKDPRYVPAQMQTNQITEKNLINKTFIAKLFRENIEKF